MLTQAPWGIIVISVILLGVLVMLRLGTGSSKQDEGDRSKRAGTNR